MNDRSTTEVVDVPERHRFEILVDGELAGFTQYHERGADRLFPHTEVVDAYQGRGLATILIRAALDATRGAGKGVLPACPAVRSFIARHPAYLDLVPADRRTEYELAQEVAG